jgi:hypothetical protein
MTVASEAPDGDSLVGVNNIAPISRNTSAKARTSSVHVPFSGDYIHSLDYVLLFRPPSKNASDREDQLETLIIHLDRVGLEVECRYGGNGSVLVFVRCPEVRLHELVDKARYSTF